MQKQSQQLHLWTIICDSCNNEVSTQDGMEIIIDANGKKAFFCNVCLDKFASSCEHCYEWFVKSMISTVGDENWCEKCKIEDAFQCQNCNSYFPTQEMGGLVDNEHWCSTCVDESANYCDHHEENTSEELNTVYDTYNTTESWCDDCISSEAFRCDDCNEYYNTNFFNGHHIDGEDTTICESCFTNNYFYCEGCDRNLSNSAYYEDGYCEECAPRGIREQNNIEDSDADIFSDFYKLEYDPEILTGTTKPYMGIEFETFIDDFEIIDELNQIVRFNGKFGILKEDASLDDEGVEIVSVPMLLEDQKNKWKDLFDSHVIDSFSNTHYGAGIHIHLNRNSLSNLGLARLLFLIYGQKENKRFTEIIAERKPTAYWSNNPQDIKTLYKNRAVQLGRDRYEAVNLRNNNTIEFRMFNSVANNESFYKNLEYVDAVYNFCNDEVFVRPTWQNFVKYAKVNESKYPNLVSFLFNYYIDTDEQNNFIFKGKNTSTLAENYLNSIFQTSNSNELTIFYKKDNSGETVFCTEDGLNWWATSDNNNITLLCGKIPQGENFNFIPIEKLNS